MEAAVSSGRARYRSKQGRHGTLYLWKFPYKSADQGDPDRRPMGAWGYDEDHAREDAIDSLEAQGWEYGTDYTLGRGSRVRE